MKLLFYTPLIRGGGAGRVISIICNELSERGHDVYLAFDTAEISYELNNKITIIHLPHKTFFHHYTEIFKLIKDRIRIGKQIRKIAVDIKPDIIISFVEMFNAHVIISTLGLKIPVISSEHTTFDKKRSLYESFCRFYINKLASKVSILTKSDYFYLNKRLPNKVVIPNPLSFSIFEGKNKKKQNVLCVGRVNDWEIKGFDTIIKIWGNIAPTFPEWTLDIAGNGNETNFNYLKQLTKENNVENSVNFLGFRKDIDQLMRESSIFCLSSRREGFPMVLIEAMSQGCASVAFNCRTGPGEIITNGISGILVQDQDAAGMENALISVMINEDLRQKLTRGGKKEVKKFDVNLIVDKWEVLFKEVLKK